MEAFLDCVSCSGFVPHDSARCPHCGKSVRRKVAKKKARPSAMKRGLLGALATAATGGLMSITLMACYGLPMCEGGPDSDGDGYAAPGGGCYNPEADCDDDNPDIHPGADDPEGDGIDQNCDGVDGDAGNGSGGNGGSGGSGANGGGGSGGAGGAGGSSTTTST